MSSSLSYVASRKAADARITSFRQLFGLVLAVEAVLAIILLLWPASLVTDPTPEIRLIGALLAWVVLSQLPGQRHPVHARPFVIIGMIGRAVLGVTCLALGGGLFAAGLIALAADLALLILFHSMVSAVLMSRP